MINIAKRVILKKTDLMGSGHYRLIDKLMYHHENLAEKTVRDNFRNFRNNERYSNIDIHTYPSGTRVMSCDVLVKGTVVRLALITRANTRVVTYSNNEKSYFIDLSLAFPSNPERVAKIFTDICKLPNPIIYFLNSKNLQPMNKFYLVTFRSRFYTVSDEISTLDKSIQELILNILSNELFTSSVVMIDNVRTLANDSNVEINIIDMLLKQLHFSKILVLNDRMKKLIVETSNPEQESIIKRVCRNNTVADTQFPYLRSIGLASGSEKTLVELMIDYEIVNIRNS